MADSYYHGHIHETHLDAFGHLNNARYLELYEHARWRWLEERGITLETIQATGVGLVILKAEINYRQELKARQAFVIETRMENWRKKIFIIAQQLKLANTGEVASDARFTGGLFDMQTRKLINPTPDWLLQSGLSWQPE